jgi:hypothetical protein
VIGMITMHFSHRMLAAVSAALLLTVAACGNDSNSSTGPTGCQIITGVTTTTFPASGGSASISVGTSNSCAWTAVSSASFLTVSQGASGSGDGTVQFTLAPNTGPQRTATLTITGTAILITQQGQ